jgi:hypothetical protein
MQALLLEERMLTELDNARSSRLIRSDSRDAFTPPTLLDALLDLMRRHGQSLRRCVNRLLRQERGRGKNGNDFRTFRNAELRGLLNRLKRNELDLRERLAVRVEALGGAEASISDPLYQRHYFAVESLEAQRVGVERELFRRDLLVN